MSELDVAAKKTLEDIAKTKEWKGETTAGCLYWLGLMEERQGHNAEAVAYYRRTYQAWKKYEVWSAKAYLGAARLFATKLDQKKEAKDIITEARVFGTPVEALCGYVWVPTKDPKTLPLCSKCETLWEAMKGMTNRFDKFELE